MKIILTDHARARIKERNITIQTIKLVLTNPDVLRQSFDDRHTATKVVAGETIEVVYTKEKGEKYIIITAYYGN